MGVKKMVLQRGATFWCEFNSWSRHKVVGKIMEIVWKSHLYETSQQSRLWGNTWQYVHCLGSRNKKWTALTKFLIFRSFNVSGNNPKLSKVWHIRWKRKKILTFDINWNFSLEVNIGSHEKWSQAKVKTVKCWFWSKLNLTFLLMLGTLSFVRPSWTAKHIF